MNKFKTMTKDFFFRSKDIMTVIFFTLLGLGGFILYLSFFTTAMLWIALTYLTFAMFKSRKNSESEDEGQAFAYQFNSSDKMNECRFRLSQV